MSKIKICIDPGHGGSDRYNRGKTGYIEADGMLDISLKLRDELLSTGAFDILMTRDKDMTVGVSERGNIAARWGANMFISEHSNATGKATNTTRRTVDVYYSIKRPNDKDLANKFAKSISQVMNNKVGGAKTWESTNYPGNDYLGVINASAKGNVPHIFLIENGFHDNLEDEAVLKNPEKRTEIAKAQAKVICDFYGVQYPVKVVKEMDWKQKIVKEAYDLGLITSEEWLEKAEEKATVWFVLATLINLYNKLKG